MADDKQQIAPKQAASTVTITVGRITFVREMDVPGERGRKGLTSALVAKGSADKRYTMEYLPHLRHHRVTYTGPGKTEPEIAMIHETHVASWEPVAS